MSTWPIQFNSIPPFVSILIIHLLAPYAWWIRVNVAFQRTHAKAVDFTLTRYYRQVSIVSYRIVQKREGEREQNHPLTHSLTRGQSHNIYTYTHISGGTRSKRKFNKCVHTKTEIPFFPYSISFLFSIYFLHSFFASPPPPHHRIKTEGGGGGKRCARERECVSDYISLDFGN